MNAAANVCFRLRGVTKSYPPAEEGGPSVIALNCRAIEIPWNARVAVLGHSGSGKSTFLNLLGLLDTPDEPCDPAPGQIVYDGAWCLAGMPSADETATAVVRKTQRDALRRREFGFVFQFHHLLDFLRCRDNATLELGLAGVPREQRRQTAQELFKCLGLEGHLEKFPRQLSGGEQQRVAVLRAVAHDPRVVLADEPTGNLDAANAARVLNALEDWQVQHRKDGRPRTLLLATHNINDAFTRCDHFLILHQGRLVDDRLLDLCEIKSAEDLGRRLVSLSVEGPPPETVTCSPPLRHSRNGAAADNGRAPPGYLWFLTWSDLREHLVPALTNGLMLLMLVVLAVVGCGLLEGKRLLMSRELEGRAALRLEANCLSRGQRPIDPELLAQLASVTAPDGRRLLPSAARLHPWNLADLLFWQAPAGQPASKVDHYVAGRSIQADDSMLGGLVGREDDAHVFSADTAWEIVVTVDFLQDAQYPPDASVIWLDCKSVPVPLTVRHKVPALPGGYRFLVPDGFYRQQAADSFDPDPLGDRVWLAPFPAVKEDEVRQRAQAVLAKRHLELHVVGNRLEIRQSQGRLLHTTRLRQYAQEIQSSLESAGVLAHAATQLQVAPSATQSGKSEWTHVSLDAAVLDDLKPLAEAIAPYGLNVEARYIEAMDRLRKTVGPLAAVLVFVVVIAGLVVTVNLGLTTWQRVVQSKYQIGILKASGMRTRDVALLLTGQAALLGALSGILGIFVGRSLGRIVGRQVTEGWFSFSVLMGCAVVAAAILITVTGSLLGTAWIIRRRPVELLVR